VIDASYRRFLSAMEAHLGNQKFMLGNRPGAGDFGLHGQLTQLVGFDPTSRAIAHEVSPRTVAWVDQIEDQSGLEPKEQDWTDLKEQPESLKALLSEIGRVYAPAQLANAKAVERVKRRGNATLTARRGCSRPSPIRPSVFGGRTNSIRRSHHRTAH
jgi:hypothetical protein